MKAYSVTDKGRVRSLNEDYYYIPGPGENFACVADGMGGHAAGEVASYLAVSTLAHELRQASGLSVRALTDAFIKANTAVLKESAKDSSKQGMGTTLTCVWYTNRVIFMGHIGDSRAYRLRDGVLTRMSTDHSYVEELVRSGIITPEQARTHPKRNIITRCIGVFDEIEPQIEKFDYRDRDIWLLCSDGLVSYVADDEIRAMLMTPGKQNGDKVRALRDMALARGGADNITIVMLTGGGRNE